MKLIFILFLIFILLPQKGASQALGPDFDFGRGEEHFNWGTVLPNLTEESDFELRLGTRLQGSLENKTTRLDGGIDAPVSQDFYVRRARLQVAAKMSQQFSFYMDMRADRVDNGVSRSDRFAVGDAFLQVSQLFKVKELSLRLFRAKYDISRTQTVSSARILVINRAEISDYASEYISHGRRGSNIQLLGNWRGKVRAQVVVGDSVHESTFMDAFGQKNVTLNSQNLAYGARVRLSPFDGWEEKQLTETHFGQGQHFSFGLGSYFVDNINFTTNNQTQEVDRQLYNLDLSFNVNAFSIMAEYFLFDGMVENFNSPNLNIGKSEGWFGQVEYVLTDFHYLAPYVRVQKWNRFEERQDYDQNSWLVGLNYYMQGNKLRMGAYVQNTDYAQGLTSTGILPDSDTLVNMNFMMHY